MVKAFPAFPFHKERMTQAFVNLGVTQAMSPNINSFVGDLVAMAQAVEELPKVQDQLDTAKRQIELLSDTVQARELSILSYKQQIEDLQSKVRSLEVERDDASFRVLEAEDINHVILGLARSAATNLAAITDRLEPPKPEPEVEVTQPVNTIVHHVTPNADYFGQSEIERERPQDDRGVTETHLPPDWKQDQAETSRMPPDQSAVDPTASTTIPSSEIASSAGSQDTAPTSTSEPSNPDAEGVKPLGPYFNKRYYDQSEAIPLDQWLAGDGTETDYHWRPSIRYAPEY